VTAAQDIGVWNKDEPLREREPWTYVRRRVHLDSEMTRSVSANIVMDRLTVLYVFLSTVLPVVF